MVYYKTFFLVPMTLGSPGLQVLVPVGGILSLGDTTVILNWKLALPPGHFGLLMPLKQQTKKGVTVPAGVTDPMTGKLSCY